MLSLPGLFRWHRHAFTTRPARRRRFPGRSFRPRYARPQLEALEDRLVLSSIIDLGIGGSGTILAVNKNGDVVWGDGNSSFLSNNGATPVRLNGLSVPYAISDNGVVVGSDSSGNSTVVYQYNSANNTVTQIANLGKASAVTLGPGTELVPENGISPSGNKLVGTFLGTQWAFEVPPPYSPSTIQGLPAPPSSNDYSSGSGIGINDKGQVAGYFQMSSNSSTDHAAFYNGTQWQDLGNLIGDPFSVADAINASGTVVGYSISSSDGMTGTDHAFLYNGTMTRLQPLSGYTNIEANDINSDGWIAGSAGNGDNAVAETAVLWKGNSAPIDLNTLLPANSGWYLEDAYAINDAGQIVGWGSLNGNHEAFLLNLNAVTLSPSSLPAGAVGTPYTQIITASDGVGNSTLAITSGALPPGMTATPKGNELVITGTPTDSGTFTFTVTATDPADPADNNSQSYTLRISPQTGPTLFQAIEGLLFDGIGLAVDMVTHRDTAGIQANIAFDMPYAGPLGQMFLDYSFAATLNAILHGEQLPPGI